MSNTTLIVIILLLFFVFGGGYYGRGAGIRVFVIRGAMRPCALSYCR